MSSVVDEYHYHSMALENLNYDLCESCYQSVDEQAKEMYWPTKLNPWTQYAQVGVCVCVCVCACVHACVCVCVCV